MAGRGEFSLLCSASVTAGDSGLPRCATLSCRERRWSECAGVESNPQDCKLPSLTVKWRPVYLRSSAPAPAAAGPWTGRKFGHQSRPHVVVPRAPRHLVWASMGQPEPPLSPASSPRPASQRRAEGDPEASSTTQLPSWATSAGQSKSVETAPLATDNQSEENGQISVISLLQLLKDAWMQGVVTPLGNFGMGKRSIQEGGVGLFLASGVVLLVLVVGWVQGVRVRSQTKRYQAIFEFSQACGLAVGTPVRIRGVDVGSVVGVRPSLDKVDAVVEIMDENVVIPRNSLIEVNQSGLISETLVDITPQLPIPEPSVGPTHPHCSQEGLIVCNRERIAGMQGVSLDELVGICTKIAKEMDKQGIGNMFDALDRFSALAAEAKPLVEKVNAIAADVQPMLSGIKDGELLKNLENLSSLAVEAAKDLKELNSAVMADGNSQLLRESVTTLTKTLKHIESISADVSTLTGDPNTRGHLKQLIESLSRIVVD